MSNVLDKAIRVGCQSWGYDDWITPAGGPYVFYLAGLKKSEMLPFYSKVFKTVRSSALIAAASSRSR